MCGNATVYHIHMREMLLQAEGWLWVHRGELGSSPTQICSQQLQYQPHQAHGYVAMNDGLRAPSATQQVLQPEVSKVPMQACQRNRRLHHRSAPPRSAPRTESWRQSEIAIQCLTLLPGDAWVDLPRMGPLAASTVSAWGLCMSLCAALPIQPHTLVLTEHQTL